MVTVAFSRDLAVEVAPILSLPKKSLACASVSPGWPMGSMVADLIQTHATISVPPASCPVATARVPADCSAPAITKSARPTAHEPALHAAAEHDDRMIPSPSLPQIAPSEH